MTDRIHGQGSPSPAGEPTKMAAGTENLLRLPRGRTENSPMGAGIVGALIVGSVALVVALMALTIAIGRAPQSASADQRPTVTETPSAGPVTFSSPEQTGKRWTAEPIVTGVPQYQPSYEPTPTPTPSADTPDPDEDEEGNDEDHAPAGSASVVNPGQQMPSAATARPGRP